MRSPEIQAHMGDDVTTAAIRWQLTVNVKPDAKRLREARAAGINCQTIALVGPGGSFVKGGPSQSLFSFFFVRAERIFILQKRPD